MSSFASDNIGLPGLGGEESLLGNNSESQTHGVSREDAGTPVGDENPRSDSDEEDDVQITIGDIKTSVSFRGPLGAPKPAFAPGAQKQSGQKLDLDSTATVNGQSIYELDVDSIEDKPWRKPGADLTDYFNYGFTEETWTVYCDRQRRLRQEFQSAANKVLFAGSGPLNILSDRDRQKFRVPHVSNLATDNIPHIVPPQNLPPNMRHTSGSAAASTPQVPQVIPSLGAHSTPVSIELLSIPTTVTASMSQMAPTTDERRDGNEPPGETEREKPPQPVTFSVNEEEPKTPPTSSAPVNPPITTGVNVSTASKESAAAPVIKLPDFSQPPPGLPPINVPPPGFMHPRLMVPPVPGTVNLPPPGLPLPPGVGLPPPGMPLPGMPPVLGGHQPVRSYAGFESRDRRGGPGAPPWADHQPEGENRDRSPASYSDKSSDLDERTEDRHEPRLRDFRRDPRGDRPREVRRRSPSPFSRDRDRYRSRSRRYSRERTRERTSTRASTRHRSKSPVEHRSSASRRRSVSRDKDDDDRKDDHGSDRKKKKRKRDGSEEHDRKKTKKDRKIKDEPKDAPEEA